MKIYDEEELQTEVATHAVLINQLQETLLKILEILTKKGIITDVK